MSNLRIISYLWPFFSVVLQLSTLTHFYWRYFHPQREARFDLINPVAILVLAVMGVFFIYSAQIYTGLTQYKQQIVWILAGGVAYFVVSHLDYAFLRKHAHWIYLLSLFGLLLVWSPIGDARGGSQRWIDLRFFTVQPSEMAKLGLLVMVATVLAGSRLGTVRDSLVVLVTVGVFTAVPLLMIFLQPDLGSSLVIPPMILALLWAANLSWRFFAVAILAVLFLISIVALDVLGFYQANFAPPPDEETAALVQHEGQLTTFLPLRDYQRTRILVFAAPESVDPMGAGWNVRQSLISVGSGGLVGKGWREGTQAQLGYLPRGVAHNDFIFSVLAEETGFLGSSLVIGLYGVLLTNGIRIAGMAKDTFGKLLCLGVTTIFAVHVFVNIGMTIGLMPITGLPLPFLSYGGSFFVSCCLLQGLVQSVYRYRKDLS